MTESFQFPIKSLEIGSFEDACEKLSDPDHGITHIISIGSNGRHGDGVPPNLKSVPNVLRLEFADYTTDDIRRASRPGAQDFELWGRPAQLKDVKQLIEFSQSMDKDTTLYAHCAAGISRSTTSAWIVLHVLCGPGSEEATYNMVRARRRIMWPKDHLVQVANAALGYKKGEGLERVFWSTKNRLSDPSRTIWTPYEDTAPEDDDA